MLCDAPISGRIGDADGITSQMCTNSSTSDVPLDIPAIDASATDTAENDDAE